MPYNLLAEPWLPFRLRSGGQAWLTIADVVAGVNDDGDYAVEADWPRPDFNIATYELLIGVFSIALQPRTHEEWKRRWRKAPSSEEVRAALEPMTPAFNLDGEGPRFLQEAGLQGSAYLIEALLIDSASENARDENKDLLTHSGRYAALSLPTAAMALYTLQAFAPAGGRGNRTSLRGGGPLIALVIPTVQAGDPPVPLWRKLWANVPLRRDDLPPLEAIFPWLKPQSRDKDQVYSEPALGEHPHAFFGMPRRVQLVFAESGRCGMTGREGPVATGFQQKPSGINYGIWKHPLTPYARQKPAGEQYSVKPKAGRFGYRDWVATTLGDGQPGTASLREPAAAVATARSDRRAILREDEEQPDARVRVGGWKMNNMEAGSYLVAEEPLHLALQAIDAAQADNLARALATAGDLAHSALRGALRQALFSGPDGPSYDSSLFRETRDAFYEQTDEDFHEVLADALEAAARTGDLEAGAAGASWLRKLRRTAFEVFDGAAPAPVDDAEKALQIVKARARLLLTLDGWGKDGAALFQALGLAAREKPATKAKRGARKEEAGA